MNDLSSRVRDYLDRKKPAQSIEMTPDVEESLTPEYDQLVEDWNELKSAFKTPIFIFKCIVAGFVVILIMWAMAVVDIQNDCYLNKECREWVKNR